LPICSVGEQVAFGPGHADLPKDLIPVGQPVLVAGSMGTATWVLRDVNDNPPLASAAHGTGRVMSHRIAKKKESGSQVRDELEAGGFGPIGVLKG
jgi:tRNA-splicing ligase RtcB